MVTPPDPLSWAPLLTAVASLALPFVAALAFLGNRDDSDFFAALVFVCVAAIVLGLSVSAVGALWWVVRALRAHGRLPNSAVAGMAAWLGGIAAGAAWFAGGMPALARYGIPVGLLLTGEVLVALGARRASPHRRVRPPRLPSRPHPPVPA
jgi:hypothetical protein